MKETKNRKAKELEAWTKDAKSFVEFMEKAQKELKETKTEDRKQDNINERQGNQCRNRE